VQAVGSGLCGQRLRARDESALEVAPPDRRLDRRPTAFTTTRYTNRQPLPFLPLNPSVRPSVCHTLALCQYDSRYDHGVFAVG